MKNIIKFIGKFNTATLAVFTALYIGCLIMLLIAINPKYTYYIEPDYNHNTGYSEIANSFQVIFKRNLEDGKLTENYSVRMAVNSRTSFEDKTDKNYTIVKYQAELLQTDQHEYYFDEVGNANTSWARTTYLGEGHEPSAFFAKLRYIDDNNETKTVTFKEKMFDAPKSLKDYQEGNVIKFGDVQFIYQVVKSVTDGENYISMRMVSTVNDAYHIDLQSWILTEDGDLLPFAGAYGLNNGTWNCTNEKVINELNAKAIVCKAICYYNGEEFEMHYMAIIDSMTSTYSSFENVDAKKVTQASPSDINKVIAIVAISATIACAVAIVVLCVVKVKKNKNSKKLEANGSVK